MTSLLLLLACQPELKTDTGGLLDSTAWGPQDNDGDGVSENDCDDNDATVYPGAEELEDGKDNDCDGEIDEGFEDPEDLDGDGWTVEDGDCDDEDAEVHPDALDDCEQGIDKNCDGVVEMSDYYRDADGDTYGAGEAFTACNQPDGYVENDEDCDDADEEVHPEADEICNGIDDDCDGYIDDEDPEGVADAWYPDLDGDGYGDPGAEPVYACEGPEGYVLDDGDCDDSDGSVHPAADELCDGVDNDCDGELDEDEALDASTWYADADSDGYGDADDSMSACEQPSGYVGDDTDCDDTDYDVNPAADEVCDDIDNDCDGLIDDEDDSLDASTADTWYADSDGDSYGDADSSLEACDQPSGYVSDDQDCDDTDASLNPDTVWYADDDGDGYGDSGDSLTQCEQPSGYVSDATDCDDTEAGVNPGEVEVCDASDTDEDCDGYADDDDPEGADGMTTAYPDDDGDTYGDMFDGGTDYCDVPSTYVEDNTDCDDSDASVNPGATEVSLNGIDDDCDGYQDAMLAEDESAWTIVGTNSSHQISEFGGLLLSDDLDGDGDTELLIAASRDDTEDSNAGAVALHDLDDEGAAVDFDAGSLLITGTDRGDYFGNALTRLGDVDGDGAEELAIAGYLNDDGDDDAGQIWFLDIDGLSGENAVTSVDQGWIRSYSEDAWFGYSQSVGDFDGDGDADFAVGAPGRSDEEGRVRVFFGSDEWWSDTQSSGSADYELDGNDEGDLLGTAVHLGLDADGDGYDDLVACGRDIDDNGSNSGTCYLIYGESSPEADDEVDDYSSAEFTGAASSDRLGYNDLSVRSADLSGDGDEDLVFGVQGYGSGGAVWVFNGGSGFTGTLTDTDADALITGDGALGTSFDMKDFTGNGSLDLLVGAPSAGDSTEGRAYLLQGPITGDMSLPDDQYASWTGANSGDELGAAVGGLEDLDGDGTEDIALGAPGNDDAASSAGIVYILMGY